MTHDHIRAHHPQDPADDPALTGIARRLEDERPLPDPTFRGGLRRHLLDASQRAAGIPGARRLAASCGASGLWLFGIVLAGIAGVGPFSA